MLFGKAKIIVIGDDPGRLVQPLRLEVAKAASLWGAEVSRFVPARMQAAEFEHGGPQKFFQEHAELPRVFHLTEICAHGAWLDTFISAPRKLDIEQYKLEIKRMAVGLSYHHRDPGIVSVTKYLAGKDGGRDSEFNVWFDLYSRVIFTFDVEAARHIVVGPTARLGQYPVPVEEGSTQAA